MSRTKMPPSSSRRLPILFLLFTLLIVSVSAQFTANTNIRSYISYVDHLPTPEKCQRRCTLLPTCMSFSYHIVHADLRCYLSAEATSEPYDCPPGETCALFGVPETGMSPTSIRDGAIETAASFCDPTMTSPSPSDALQAAEDLNVILHYMHEDTYAVQTVPTFFSTLTTAMDRAYQVLSLQDDGCYGAYAHTSESDPCTNADVLHLQLRALWLSQELGPDGSQNTTLASLKAFPQPRDEKRRNIFAEHRILVADSGWFTAASLNGIQHFLDEIPPSVLTNGVTFGAEFATLSVKDAYKCGGGTGVDPNFLSFTERGFDVVRQQIGTGISSTFPDDTPVNPPDADTLLTSIRHGVLYQVNQMIPTLPSVQATFAKLVQISSVNDDYLRSSLGYDHFQNEPDEIMASQLGEQYFHSTSAQLRLAAERLQRGPLSPTLAPTQEPSSQPSSAPSESFRPTVSPTETPSASPTDFPTQSPTSSPTSSPTATPTQGPTSSPTSSPTEGPTDSPTSSPTEGPTDSPTESPTASPTSSPTSSPTAGPTSSPTSSPTESPTPSPTSSPTSSPTESPTSSPTVPPTDSPTSSPTTTPPTPSPTDPIATLTNMIHSPQTQCADRHYLSNDFATPYDCALEASTHASCTGAEIMWVPQSWGWGCRCCKRRAACETEEDRLYHHNYWNIYQYADKVEPPDCVANATLYKDDFNGRRWLKNLGYFINEHECAIAAVADSECDGGSEIVYSQSYPGWGCGCLAPHEDCDTDETLYTANGNWGIYQYRPFETPLPCSTRRGLLRGGESSAAKMTEEEEHEEEDHFGRRELSAIGTRIPLAWFLLNLDILSGGTNTVPFYEDNRGTIVDGYSTKVQVTLTRDVQNRITSAAVPGCDGPILFGYHAVDDIVVSVTPNALTCITDLPPTNSPTQVPTSAPSSSPTSAPSCNPSHKPNCILLTESECQQNCLCTWDTNIGACAFTTPSSDTPYTSWHGYVELGQTHVIHATHEPRHAPRVIAEREAELLFTPTLDKQPTQSPTSSPTETIVHTYGLETLGTMDITISPDYNQSWPDGFPRDVHELIDDDSSAYYIPNDKPDVDINFDLGTDRLLQGVYVKSWYVTKIDDIKIGIHPDDGYEGDQPGGNQSLPDGGWTWFDAGSVPGCCNHVRSVHIPKIPARYVTIRLTGGYSYYGTNWGLRNTKISGYVDGLLDDGPTNEENGNEVDSVGYIPPMSADMRVAAYDSGGSLLGVLQARNYFEQRPILEQALIEGNTTLDLYGTENEMWSATLPWDWVKEGTEILMGIIDPTKPEELLVHRLVLRNLAMWGEHQLTRTKVIIFGTEQEFDELDTKTLEPERLATGMFNIMPLAELRWVDSELWHLPYLVVSTSLGPRLVHSEAERRDVMVEAGDDVGTEPPWIVLKNQLAFRHTMAQTGHGFAVTTQGEGGGSSYSSGTSIFMGWALSNNNTDDGSWIYDKMGYWGGWAAAAWTGWVGMRPGDECGNLLAHELGHSQTMSHFTTGSASNWGISDEYPQDGTNLETHPWGYDTVTRRFRTWYDHNDGSGKRDPMNGGEPSNAETCYPQYTGYHAKKSQNWAKSYPVLLSATHSDVPIDGAYKYSSSLRAYEHIDTNGDMHDVVSTKALLPEEVAVPVITIIGTLGDTSNSVSSGTCQIYSPLRASSGNTFQFPDPFNPTALPASIYNNAAHYVEVQFKDTSIANGLIAVPSMAGSTELRYFSFTIAASRRPQTIKLYKFDADTYPNLTPQSAKTLLYTRAITLPTDPLHGLSKPVRVGKGWLGSSGDVTIKGRCISDSDCNTNNEEMRWRGTNGDTLVYQTDANVQGHTDTESMLTIRVTKKEDGTNHDMTVLASRFVKDDGESYPLLLPVSSSTGPIAPDESHGVKFWAPYDLNSNLEFGTYSTANDDIVNIWADDSSGERFSDIRLSIEFSILEKTATVDLTGGVTYISDPAFYANGSSAYFLATDPTIGPMKSVWWGGSSETLTIPLETMSCPTSVDTNVIAKVKAQQKTTCSSTKWQFNAGRSANDCGHSLVLTLQNDVVSNPWLEQTDLQGCLFTTHPATPVLINSHRWHNPGGGNLLGTLVLEMKVIVADPGT